MLDNKFASFEDKIQKHKETKIIGLKNELETLEMRLEEIEKKNQENKQSTKKDRLII